MLNVTGPTIKTVPDQRQRVVIAVTCGGCGHTMAATNPPTCPINFCNACGRALTPLDGLDRYINPHVGVEGSGT